MILTLAGSTTPKIDGAGDVCLAGAVGPAGRGVQSLSESSRARERLQRARESRGACPSICLREPENADPRGPEFRLSRARVTTWPRPSPQAGRLVDPSPCPPELMSLASVNARGKVRLTGRRAAVFWPCSVRYRRTSGPAVTGCMHTSTAARWPSDSPPGTRSSACPPPPNPGDHAAAPWARTARSPQPRQPDSAAVTVYEAHGCGAGLSRTSARPTPERRGWSARRWVA